MHDELDGWTQRPVYAALFGSAARGQMRPDSDIDVFIVVPDAGDESGVESCVETFAARVSRWTGNDTRPLVWSESDILLRSGEPVLRDIVNEGTTVWGSATWLRRQVRTADTVSR